MKHFFIPLLLIAQLYAQDQSVYTLTGKKDSRLDARYTISYVATNLQEGCGSRGYTTGTMKPSITQRSVSVPDGNYTISLPIYMTPEEDKKVCGYRFAGLDLRIMRKNDNDRYSRFELMGNFRRNPWFPNANHEPIVTYNGYKGGEGSANFVGMDRKETPNFTSDKKYFRIAPETTFICMTQDRIYDYELPKWRKEAIEKYGHTDFMCTMKMKLDTEGGKFHFNECTKEERLSDTQHRCGVMTHPEFGVDEITSDTLHIDILVDESKCQLLRFRDNLNFTKESDVFCEISKPAPSALESFKSLF